MSNANDTTANIDQARTPATRAAPTTGQLARARARAEEVLKASESAGQSPLPALIATYEARLATFGETCTLTDEIARVQNGLPEDPTPADKRKHTMAEKAHQVAARALLDYQPRSPAELATLAQMFTRLDVCDPEDGIEALARMAAGLIAPPPPGGSDNPPSGGDVADMLAQRQEFNDWLERTDLAQPNADAAMDTMDKMDAWIARAPIMTARDAAAKLRLLQHDTTGERHRPGLALDVLAQVAGFLGAVDWPPIGPDDAELIAMAPEWDRLEAEWTARNVVSGERMRAARRAVFCPANDGMSSDARFELLCEAERRQGVYDPDADTDTIARQMDALTARARQLVATTVQGLAVKVAMCARYHTAEGDQNETDELLHNLGLMAGRPFLMARVDGADFYTPFQWITTFLKQGGTFTRQVDGKLFMVTPSSPDVEYLEHMKRSVGLLPNPDGTTTEPPAGFLDAVWDTAAWYMDERGSDVLFDEKAQERRAALLSERVGLAAAAQ